ncbi:MULTISPECIES: lysozyme [Methylobacterium]|uniref:Lysozyme n=1 Tax=Methylobacterium jeotgali TaxID=381630 RepID=A0ABQ4SQS6_9HYPH|nr:MULTISPECIES: lysozyme [Methylobacterium]PIU07438.1 MAG: glycoside hydrolase [Methylobacterium sp. CG09_land_8_20_14_0_10_71_15]PIU13974.1 MAG: glycoside hydrolase [Methylobacterium sp. CG08_land_8_20_14_0_20_71_15]GBU17326.1 hypothetical protein AwMethylo_15410 [Methylobacterium sp.]GJE05520.1 hypothetical protein AOPFMNJM_0820 [Methylobacterium jeotgali]
MELSAIGRAVLVAREGARLEAYRDSVGVWTIGVGHTSAAGPPTVRPGLTITPEECEAIFARDVARFARTVAQAVPEDLPDHAFDALVSLCFNIGQGAFLRSTLLRRLRAGDRAGAAEAILMWNRPAAILPRRQAEHDQFLTPYATAMPCARRGDTGPVNAPRPARSAERRPLPRGPAPVAPRRPAEPPAPPRSGLAALWRWLLRR